MKKILSVLICISLLFGIFCTALTVSAAPSQIRVTGYKVLPIASAAEPSQYIYIFLDTEVNNARQMQTTDRVLETEVPEDSWDFPDSLTDAARKYILVNGTKLGDYIDAAASPFGCAVCYEKAKDFDGKQTLTIGLHSDAFPGTNPEKDDYTIEIKAGFFASVDGWKTLIKFEPTTLSWNHATQKLTIKRKGDNGKTLEEALSGGGETNSTPTTSSTTSSSGSSTTSKPTETTSSTADASSEDTSGEVEVVVEPGVSSLQVTDVLSNSDSIKVDFDNNTVKLDKSMTIKELMSNLNINTAYKAGIYNGRTLVDEETPVYTGYKLKIYEGENLIGNLYVEAPEPTESASISPMVWVIAAVGVVLLAAAAVLVIILLRKKKSGGK